MDPKDDRFFWYDREYNIPDECTLENAEKSSGLPDYLREYRRKQYTDRDESEISPEEE